MIQKIKLLLLMPILTLAMLAAVALPAVVYAQTPPPAAADANIDQNLCAGADTLTFNDPASGSGQCPITGDPTNTFNDVLATTINIISIVVGVIAVIMIIFGGFRYVTSGGDATKVTSAKNTILYGLIGLVIVALAQIIVRFGLQQTSGTISP